MINITNKKEEFIPIRKFENGIIIAFGYKDYYKLDENGNLQETTLATWTEHTFENYRTIKQIKQFILDELDSRTDKKIISGFVWKDMPIWLSSENQFNYKAAFDLAIQLQGQNLPIKFKFGEPDNPIYYTFTNIDDLQDFYISALNYINKTLEEGWQIKDAIDWNKYIITDDTVIDSSNNIEENNIQNNIQ